MNIQYIYEELMQEKLENNLTIYKKEDEFLTRRGIPHSGNEFTIIVNGENSISIQALLIIENGFWLVFECKCGHQEHERFEYKHFRDSFQDACKRLAIKSIAHLEKSCPIGKDIHELPVILVRAFREELAKLRNMLYTDKNI